MAARREILTKKDPVTGEVYDLYPRTDTDNVIAPDGQTVQQKFSQLNSKVEGLEKRPSGAVDSVNGKTGAVTITAEGLGAASSTELNQLSLKLNEIPQLYVKVGDTYTKLEIDAKILQAAVGTIDKVGGYVTEDGFFVTDAEGNVMFKVDNDGIDFAEIAQHAIDLLVAKGIGKGGGTTYQSMAEVAEDGFYVVDGSMNIGYMITSTKAVGFGGGDSNTIYQQASDKVYNVNI